MEIPKGYKQTEVGIIPADWDVKQLGELCSLFGRIGFRGYTKKDLVRKGEGAITFSPSDIHDSKLDYSNCDYISIKKYEESPEIKVFNGDILFVKTASIGKCAIVKSLNEKATINPQFVVLKGIKCSNVLLYYKIIESSFQRNILSICGGSTIPTMSQERIKEQLIALPNSLEEQKRIAEALSDVDELIDALNQLIEKKCQIKEGAMQQLLTGKTRLPGFTEPWDYDVLGNNSNIFRGGSPRPIENYLTTSPDGVHWVKIGDVSTNAKYIETTQEKIISEGVKYSREVYAGDFLLSNSMSFGRPYILKINGCIHDGWLVIQDYQETFNIDFLYYILGSSQVNQQYKSMAAGSSVLNLNKDIVHRVVIPIPTIAEQIAIAQILSDMDEEIRQLEAERDKYMLVKQGMMQELLTGKTRLN